jgi:hypothetical protein
MRPVTRCDAIDPGRAPGPVELGRIFQAPQPPLVHLLGDPAFVPDVRMPAALVERGEYALHLGLSVARDRQPGALPMMLVEVCRAVRDADVWQASAPRLEAHESLVPLKIGDVLGAATWLDALPGRSGITMSSRLRAILAVRLFWTVAYFAHASVLPVDKAHGSQSLGEMRRKERLVLSAG